MTMTANTPTSISAPQASSEMLHEGNGYSPAIDKPAEGVSESISNPESDVDALLNVVREEGFESAFEYLAEDEGSDSDNSSEKQDEIDDQTQEVENAEFQDTNDDEKKGVFERIKELEEKVTNLEDKNKEISDRLKGAEDNLRLSLETMQQMVLVLKALVEEEEDERKKMSLLEILVTLMGNLMTELAYPEDESSQEKPQPAVINRKGSNRKESPYEELLKRLSNKKPSSKTKDVPIAA